MAAHLLVRGAAMDGNSSEQLRPIENDVPFEPERGVHLSEHLGKGTREKPRAGGQPEVVAVASFHHSDHTFQGTPDDLRPRHGTEEIVSQRAKILLVEDGSRIRRDEPIDW